MTTTANHTKTTNPFKTAQTLIITEFGGLLFVSGLFILPMLFAIIPEIFIFPSVNIFIKVLLAILVLLPAPILLAYYLTNNWKKGIIIGLCAVTPSPQIYMVELSLLVVFVIFTLMFPSLGTFIKGFPPGVLIVLPSASVIIIIILMSTKWNLLNVKSFLFRIFGIGLGFVIGLGLSSVSLILFANSLTKTPELDIPSLIIPALMWISVLYFSETRSDSNKAISFITWVLLVLVSFALAFMIQTLISIGVKF